MYKKMNKIIKIKFFVFFVLITTFSSAEIEPPFKNISVSKQPIYYQDILFEDFDGKIINLKQKNSKIYVLNFWATWCLPCKKEMPSLDKLYNKYKKIKIFPINIDNKDKYKSQTFFRNLEIKNLSIYFDANSNLAKLFRLQGIPTTVILNSKREEIARILGEIDFSDKKFINWIKKINNASY